MVTRAKSGLSPRHLWAVGLSIVAVASIAQIVNITSNVIYLNRHYSVNEIIMYVLAVAALILIPIAQAVVGSRLALQVSSVMCFLYVTMTTLGENVSAMHDKAPDTYSVVLAANIIGDVHKAVEAITVVSICITFVMLELLGRLAGLGVELIMEARKPVHRRRKVTHV